MIQDLVELPTVTVRTLHKEILLGLSITYLLVPDENRNRKRYVSNQRGRNFLGNYDNSALKEDLSLVISNAQLLREQLFITRVAH